jgi:hypothetical protein
MTTDIFFAFICKTDYSKPVKQEVNGTVILPPLVVPDFRLVLYLRARLEPTQVEQKSFAWGESD